MAGAVFTQVVPFTTGKAFAVQARGSFPAITATGSTRGMAQTIVTEDFTIRTGDTISITTRTGGTICCGTSTSGMAITV